jgi:hypothetical protein
VLASYHLREDWVVGAGWLFVAAKAERASRSLIGWSRGAGCSGKRCFSAMSAIVSMLDV